MTSQEKFDALKKVVEFAKANGFPNAHMLFWDEEYPEAGFNDVETIFEDADADVSYTIELGISLSLDIELVKTYPPSGERIECLDSGEVLK